MNTTQVKRHTFCTESQQGKKKKKLSSEKIKKKHYIFILSIHIESFCLIFCVGLLATGLVGYPCFLAVFSNKLKKHAPSMWVCAHSCASESHCVFCFYMSECVFVWKNTHPVFSFFFVLFFSYCFVCVGVCMWDNLCLPACAYHLYMRDKNRSVIEWEKSLKKCYVRACQ